MKAKGRQRVNKTIFEEEEIKIFLKNIKNKTKRTEQMHSKTAKLLTPEEAGSVVPTPSHSSCICNEVLVLSANSWDPWPSTSSSCFLRPHKMHGVNSPRNPHAYAVNK